MSRNSQIVRVLNLLFLLCRYRNAGLGIRKICELLAVSRRTLYRDLDALKEVGIEIEHVKDDSDELRVYLKKIPVLMD
jgi:predicted DNA-binding transcriptional regulator YafY